MKNCIVAQSGGPTAAINSSLAGVIFACLNEKEIDTLFGAVNGIEGILNENFINLSTTFADEKKLNLLMQTPASYLGSCRFKLPKLEEDETTYKKIFDFFKKHDIQFFFYIGGNDSMDTVDKLSAYAKAKNEKVRIMGVPKTIDNDLPETDHTPGFGSAAKYIAATVKEVSLDADVYDLKSVLIIEIMGRNAGWLTAASALARNEFSAAPHLIYLPESVFSLEAFFEDVKDAIKKYNNVVVCVSEGIRFKDGSYVCEATSSGLTDIFNHKNLSGTAKFLENAVRETLKCKARAVELNVCQRCAAHILSKTDIEESFETGKTAVSLALLGKTGEMVVIKRVKDTPYAAEFSSVPVSLAANVEKKVPEAWHTEKDILPPLLDYLRPLIMGETDILYKDGLPVHLKREKEAN